MNHSPIRTEDSHFCSDFYLLLIDKYFILHENGTESIKKTGSDRTVITE